MTFSHDDMQGIRATGKPGKETAGGIEWVGGILNGPSDLVGKRRIYRPEYLLFLVSPQGPLLSLSRGEPGVLVTQAFDHFRCASQRPLLGSPQLPDRLRVQSPELAEALRPFLPPEVELVCAPTPEVEQALAKLMKYRGYDESTDFWTQEISHFRWKASEKTLAEFFDAATCLASVARWRDIFGIDRVMHVAIPSLGLPDTVVALLEAERRRSEGLVLFSRPEDANMFLNALQGVGYERPPLPTHLVVDFTNIEQLLPHLKEEILNHRWAMPRSRNVPWLSIIERDGDDSQPTTRDLEVTGFILRGLSQFARMFSSSAQAEALEGCSEALRVPSPIGEVDMIFTLLRVERTKPPLPQDLLSLLQDDDDFGGEEVDRIELEQELLRRFALSEEGKPFQSAEWAVATIDELRTNWEVTVASLDDEKLEQILFIHIPRRLNGNREAARAVIDQNRAFVLFLQREYEFEHAEECLLTLGGNALTRLESGITAAARESVGVGVPLEELLARAPEPGPELVTCGPRRLRKLGGTVVPAHFEETDDTLQDLIVLKATAGTSAHPTPRRERKRRKRARQACRRRGGTVNKC